MSNLNETIDRMKSEIVADVLSGLIPRDVESFSDLHDYIDANCLADMCEDEVFGTYCAEFGATEDDPMPQGFVDFLNSAQGAIDEWIKAGGIADRLGSA